MASGHVPYQICKDLGFYLNPINKSHHVPYQICKYLGFYPYPINKSHHSK